MALLETDDLTPFATIDDDKAEAMIADAEAKAILAAPCLANEDLTPQQIAAAKAILRAAVLRWHEAASAAGAQVGPFGITPLPRKSLFWPSEISDLQQICKTDDSGGAFAVDTAANAMQMHSVLGYSGAGGIYGFDIPPGAA